jgi:outer membrane protein, heavy metal efflux system
MIELLKKRPAAGPVILLELRVIEGSLVEFQKSARDFETQRDAARASLNVLLGRDDDDPLDLKDDLTPPANRYSITELSKQLEKSPSLIKRLAEIERTTHEAKAAILEAKPDLEIGPFLSREDAGERETTIGLALSVPLSWRNRNQGNIAAAKANQARAEAEFASEMLSARSEIARRLRLYESAVVQVESIPVSQVESLHDAADLADRQYRLGAIPVQLFLDMQREFLNVQLLRHNALLEAMNMAAELEWLAGSAIGEVKP